MIGRLPRRGCLSAKPDTLEVKAPWEKPVSVCEGLDACSKRPEAPAPGPLRPPWTPPVRSCIPRKMCEDEKVPSNPRENNRFGGLGAAACHRHEWNLESVLETATLEYVGAILVQLG